MPKINQFIKSLEPGRRIKTDVKQLTTTLHVEVYKHILGARLKRAKFRTLPS